VAENRLDRQFAVKHPLPAWVGDITYLPTREGGLYLAVVLDMRTRQVLGYSLSERMPDDLVQQAFLNAYSAAPVGTGVLFHSDRGSQYASGDFGKTLAAHGFEHEPQGGLAVPERLQGPPCGRSPRPSSPRGHGASLACPPRYAT